MIDTYNNFKELNESENPTDFEIIPIEKKKTNVIIIAIHGGKIEPGTSEIALEIAKNKYSFYTFKGKKKIHNLRDLHIKSTNFDEPTAIKLIHESNYTISIHGWHYGEKEIIVGGLDENFVNSIKKKLLSKGFKIGDNKKINASCKKNICNKNKRGKGVQIEC